MVFLAVSHNLFRKLLELDTHTQKVIFFLTFLVGMGCIYSDFNVNILGIINEVKFAFMLFEHILKAYGNLGNFEMEDFIVVNL